MKRRIYLSAWLLFVLSACASSAFAQKVDPSAWKVGAGTPAEFNSRIEEAANRYADDGPFPRVTFFDIAYPGDAEEYAKLNGHAVLLLSAFSQMADELPLKRVYFVYQGKVIELKLIKSWPQQVVSNGVIAKTFGANRMDALYLMPIYLRAKNLPLLADFAKNKEGFHIADFSSLSERVRSLPIKEPTDADLSAAYLLQFIRREYPGLLKD